ncbi:hypothetical protein SO574_01155 [Vibrio alfacsensis]|uniref:hypothetical protein n=1 Tax=Vibrio alfacsensis TaxID=1074311 RepID=UPI002ADDF5DB|nr:hypothetical protein [Vibrio alfacsensis]WQE76441.1 hypothetical protein SO574_01155 [Vibrio alfacsensis]
MINFIKQKVQKHSDLFSLFRFVPYGMRLGSSYGKHKKLILKYDEMSLKEKEEFHFKKLKRVIEFAYENNHFYRDFYDLKNFHPSQFRQLSDFDKVPVVTKDDMKRYDIDMRSSKHNSPFRVNTGGTSGKPLGFYLDKKAFAREWAYMHNVWSKIGYSFLDLKLTFRGKNNNGIPLRYNVIHNEYVVDAYVSHDKIVESIRKLCSKKTVKYLHGYPSSIYEFCMYLKNNSICASSLFGGNLQGVFLGSEYPAKIYRDVIESVLMVPTISWYGHSEMSVLAYEKEKNFHYQPFQTYGFTEALRLNENESKLIGTSYYNFNSPFIRYDTGDLICHEEYDSSILKSFKISSGRVGDVVFDHQGSPISLTALIFGRHHKAFDIIDFIQVKQPKNGVAILYVSSQYEVSVDMFDLANIDMTFDVIVNKSPIKTKAGKVPLLIG